MLGRAPLPLLARRGGCATKKILRSHHCRHRRGGGSNSNKLIEPPPRPLLVEASRLFLMSRPPLLARRGNGARPNTHIFPASSLGAEEGWPRHQKHIAKLPQPRAAGVVLVKKSVQLCECDMPLPPTPESPLTEHCGREQSGRSP